MIKSVTITNYLGETIKLELTRPATSGFAIEFIDGLGPPKGTINTTEISTSDGGVFASSRLSQRNIVLGLIFIENRAESIERLRHKSYKFFPVKKKLRFQIETDTRTAVIEGYVESNEPDIFTNRAGCTISIICPNPYFSSVDGNIVTEFSGIEYTFEFPFSNESLTRNMIEMGTILNENTKVITYRGDGEVGITIRAVVLGEVENINFFNLDTRESMHVDTAKIASVTGAALSEGDEIIITTGKNEKAIKLIRDGESINILNCLDRGSSWFALTKGDNVFAYTCDVGQLSLQVSIEHKVIYEGV